MPGPAMTRSERSPRWRSSAISCGGCWTPSRPRIRTGRSPEMASPARSWRPRMSRRALFHHDHVRDVDVVLLPERVIKLNPTGAAVLRLCDGHRTLGQIVTELEHRYADVAVEAEVTAFLGRMVDQGIFET